jgi:hypothetical protein
MTYLDVGDGKTYSTINNALAAIPATLIDDITVRIYQKAGGNLVYNESVYSGTALTFGNYELHIIGMTGNVYTDDSQITVSQASGTAINLSVMVPVAQSGGSVQNLNIIGVANGLLLSAGANMAPIECRIIGATLALNGAAGKRITRCIFVNLNAGVAAACFSGSGFFSDCIFIGTSCQHLGGYSVFNRCTIICDKYYTANASSGGVPNASNCVFLCSGNIFPASGVTTPAYTEPARRTYAGVANGYWINNVFYSTSLGSGQVDSDTSFETLLSPFYEKIAERNYFIDPQLANTGTVLEKAVAGLASICRAKNQTAKSNTFYPTLKITPSDIGAYTDYIAPDFPSAANVLTTDTVDGVQGTYNGASADDVRLNTPIGQTNGNLVLPVTNDVVLGVEYGANGTEYTGTRNLAADYPVEPDVFLGVEYDYGNKVGTFNPYASGIQTGNLVLPTEAEVLALVGYGSNGTEFEGTLTSPDAPVLLSVVAGNTQFTATVTTSLPTDVARIIYKKNTGTSWILSSESAVGGGTITVTGLDNGNKYDVLSVVVNDGIYSPISNSLTVIPLSPAGYSRDIVRYRVIKTSDNEGGWTDTISDPVIIYPTLIYDDVNVTATLKREDDIIVEDVIQIYDLEFYRVTAIRIAVNGLHKSLSLEKIERPIWSQVR